MHLTSTDPAENEIVICDHGGDIVKKAAAKFGTTLYTVEEKIRLARMVI